MQQSHVARLVASRPSGAALASLFSDRAETLAILREPGRGRRAPSLRGLARRIVLRAHDVLLSQVPCEDFMFDKPLVVHFIRRRMQA